MSYQLQIGKLACFETFLQINIEPADDKPVPPTHDIVNSMLGSLVRGVVGKYETRKVIMLTNNVKLYKKHLKYKLKLQTLFLLTV